MPVSSPKELDTMNRHLVIDFNKADSIVLKTICPFYGKTHSFTIDVNVCTKDEFRKGYNAWKCGELIQNALPMLSPNEREFIKTGICAECWDNM